MKKRNIIGIMVAAICGFLTSCSDEILVQQAYDFSVTTLPVPKRIKKGETVEIRCKLVRSGNFQQASYYMRYFQPDGKGTLKTQDGMVFQPNDLYGLQEETFRLYYTSDCENRQVIDLYFFDNFDNRFTLSFSFNNDNEDNE